MEEEVIAEFQAALASEERVKADWDDLSPHFSNGVLTLEGEVRNIKAKKLAREHAESLTNVSLVVDKLNIRPAERMPDDSISVHLEHTLLNEPVFTECSIHRRVNGQDEMLRQATEEVGHGHMLFSVEDGVVHLQGDVPSLSHKRLAGSLAWWVPGSRNVVNELEVKPAEDDGAGEVVDAVRIVLEKDPLVDATHVQIGCQGLTVTLDGLVESETERHAAEFDVWSVFGVDDVVNQIQILPND